jgi:predicted RNase H-like nuclease (RuvC/YqgF family)
LDSQEEFLIKENKKNVKLKNAYAQEVEKCENLTKELSICHDSIICLRNENASLNAKIDKLNDTLFSLRTENDSLVSKINELNVCNDSISCLRDENTMLKSKIDELNVCKPSISTVEHVSICTRCRDINVEAINDHLALIKQQNDHIAQLTAKINEYEIENENLNLLEACSIMGDALALRMSLVSNREAMSSLMPLRNCLTLLRAKLPWFRIMRVTFYILLIILSTKLGEFMLENPTLFPIMLLCIKMRHLALGILLMLKCLKRKLLLHQMNLTFHLRLLMLHMCLLTNQAK